MKNENHIDRSGLGAVSLLLGCMMLLGLLWWGFSTMDRLEASKGAVNPEKSTVLVKSGLENGSGVWVSDTEIVTANHVLQDRGNISVWDSKGNRGSGTVIRQAGELIRVKVDGITGSPVSPNRDFSGGDVTAMGFPYGMNTLMISKGSSTGVAKTSLLPGNLDPAADWVLFSAAVNPGMSGGGVFDHSNRLLGVISWRVDTMNGRAVEQMAFYSPCVSTICD